MGLLDRFMPAKRSTPPQDPSATLGQGDVIPANGGYMDKAGGYMTKATDFYKHNPKLVGGVALLASALLLNRMKRPH